MRQQLIMFISLTLALQAAGLSWKGKSIRVMQVELEDWKTKTNKITAELNELKAQYKELEKKVALSLL